MYMYIDVVYVFHHIQIYTTQWNLRREKFKICNLFRGFIDTRIPVPIQRYTVSLCHCVFGYKQQIYKSYRQLGPSFHRKHRQKTKMSVSSIVQTMQRVTLICKTYFCSLILFFFLTYIHTQLVNGCRTASQIVLNVLSTQFRQWHSYVMMCVLLNKLTRTCCMPVCV